MKSVLISIQPKWCELIASGKKTIEVRKTRPKLETPFKCYVYCTMNKSWKDYLTFAEYKDGQYMGDYDANGKVIGEFICDCVIGHCEMANADIAEQQGCIKREVLLDYSNGNELYGWHISDLKIYDEPKALGEFRKPCPPTNQNSCLGCKYHEYEHLYPICYDKITRPPQSWCYVEV